MDADLRARLRRMRREATGEPSQSGALPSWLRTRLSRNAAPAPIATSDHARTLGFPRDLAERSNASGAFAERVTSFALEHRHGHCTLSEIDAVDRAKLVELARDESLLAFAPREAIYLDIETTGLAGGAGTKAFLIALGRFEGQRFELWQGFLRSPDEERALLEECVARIAAAPGVISFFGKAFDRHRLEDKMRLHRLAPPFADRAHLDLYYPCRRLHRAALPNCKLATLERAVCGVERERDLPGSFAPAAWFDFLAERPHLLEQVFAHNRDDVLSLVTLCARIGAT